MEVGRNLLSSKPSFPSGTHLKNCLSSSSSSTSALMLHEQAASVVTSMLSTCTPQRHCASIPLQEQRDENYPLLHVFKEAATSWGILERTRTVAGASVNEEKSPGNSNQLLHDFERQLLHWPGLGQLLPPMQTGKTMSSSLIMQPNTASTENPMDVEECDIVALAKKALSASQEAALLAEDSKLIGSDFDESLSSGFGSRIFVNIPLEEEKVVRSTRILERRSKKRRVPKSNVHETLSSRNVDVKRKISEGFDPNDPLRLFLWGPETKQLLTFEEESELIAQVQDLMKLEEVKIRLQSHFGREPTLVEWAEGVGISYRALKSKLYSGNSSREKLIYANLRMVVHVAKLYPGRGLSFQDLLQFASEIWNYFFNKMGLVWVMPGRVEDLIASWKGITGTQQIAALWRMAPICICWCIWRERNERIFKDHERSSEEFRSFFWKTLFLWAIALDFNGLSFHNFLISVSST
ncbi:RNA polymerase sigma factor sigF, chloroplastic isoform X2 [Carya illinoinensis]|uniref:RNA polymerase sigma factor sigF, chloroplastic isoform X2 n=1 Tax=Carya illinoinensis TaxID=32201 RepID=UPI001C71E621|nr:RNA polymerase sigma factor sigF, chloroplastic isoform X2 [Carya illinoinensis]